MEQQAREIVESTGGRVDLSHARSIAQAQQEVLRARSISTALVTKALASHVHGGTVAPSFSGSLDADGAEAIERAVPLIRVLDRYEHRALARRDRAIRLCFEG